MIIVSAFKEITPKEITNNPFELIGDDWALVTSGSKDKFNTMTVSWGGVGIMWGKPVAFTFIRPQRYTFEFTENNDYYTMSFFDESYRDALKFCGSKSGRDVDKVKECNLTPVFDEKAPYFNEAQIVLVCKKAAKSRFNPDEFLDGEIDEKWYPQNDYHFIYYAEIEKVLVKDDWLY